MTKTEVFFYLFRPKLSFFYHFLHQGGGESCPIQKILIRKTYIVKKGEDGGLSFLNKSKKKFFFCASSKYRILYWYHYGLLKHVFQDSTSMK